ncbi:MAG: DUF559 domain-containing protein [Streptococcus sp.]
MNEITLSNNLAQYDFQIRKFENTRHEIMFAQMYPHLKRQVVFGTGKGGYKKWMTKKFTVDFFDEENKIAYEIDGKSHKTELGWLVDRLKDQFMAERDILVIHITNEQVEHSYNEWSGLWKGVFNEFFK